MQALRKAAAAGVQPGPAPPSSLGAWLAQVARPYHFQLKFATTVAFGDIAINTAFRDTKACGHFTDIPDAACA